MSHAEIRCKACRKKRPADFEPGDAELADLAKLKHSNAVHNPKAQAQRHDQKMRRVQEMKGDGVIEMNGEQLVVNEQALTREQLKETAIAKFKSLLTGLREKNDKTEFKAVASLLLGETPFNVTKAGQHRAEFEHVAKMQRTDVHIVQKNESRLKAADYNEAIFQYEIYKSMIDSNINGMEWTLTQLLAGPSWQKRPLCTNKNHGLL